jgi:hypothetical protein
MQHTRCAGCSGQFRPPITPSLTNVTAALLLLRAEGQELVAIVFIVCFRSTGVAPVDVCCKQHTRNCCSYSRPAAAPTQAV